MTKELYPCSRCKRETSHKFCIDCIEEERVKERKKFAGWLEKIESERKIELSEGHFDFSEEFELRISECNIIFKKIRELSGDKE